LVVATCHCQGAQGDCRRPRGHLEITRLRTPLFNSSSATVVELLVEAGADVNHEDQWGYTALHTACTAEAVQELLRAGANVNALNNDCYSPLETTRNPDVVRALLAAPGMTEDVVQRALHTVRYPEVARLLLEAGADPLKPNRDGVTPVESIELANRKLEQSWGWYSNSDPPEGLEHIDFPGVEQVLREWRSMKLVRRIESAMPETIESGLGQDAPRPDGGVIL
jgi:hypothetical protein